jgi:hypothetical protein
MQAAGSNDSAGYTILPPWVSVARRPRVRPKQWKRGGGQQRVSSGVRFIRSPMKEELFIRLLRNVSLLERTCKVLNPKGDKLTGV